MSKTLYVPDHVLEKLKDPNKGVDPNRKELDKLPQPVGWRILVLPFKAKDKTKGGVLLTDKTVEDSQLTALMLIMITKSFLMDLGVNRVIGLCLADTQDQDLKLMEEKLGYLTMTKYSAPLNRLKMY